MNLFQITTLVLVTQSLVACAGVDLPSAKYTQLVLEAGKPVIDIHGFVPTVSSGIITKLNTKGVEASKVTCSSLGFFPREACSLSWQISMVNIRPPIAYIIARSEEHGRVLNSVASRIAPPGI